MVLFGEFGVEKGLTRFWGWSLGSFAYDGVLARCWRLEHCQAGFIVGYIITVVGDAIEYHDALCN